MTVRHLVFIRWLLFAFRPWSFSCVCLWLSWHWALQQQKTRRMLPTVRGPGRSDVLFPPTSSGVRVLIILAAMIRSICDYITHEKLHIKTCMNQFSHVRVISNILRWSKEWSVSTAVSREMIAEVCEMLDRDHRLSLKSVEYLMHINATVVIRFSAKIGKDEDMRRFSWNSVSRFMKS